MCKTGGPRCLGDMMKDFSPTAHETYRQLSIARRGLLAECSSSRPDGGRVRDLSSDVKHYLDATRRAITASDAPIELKSLAADAIIAIERETGAGVVKQRIKAQVAADRALPEGVTVDDAEDSWRRARDIRQEATQRLYDATERRKSRTSTASPPPLPALNPVHALPAGLVPTDSVGVYPDNARDDVIADLRDSDTRFIVVDIETTGFDPATGAQVTEISWYSLNSGDGGTFIPAHTLDGADEQALAISRYHERLAGKPQDDGTQLAALHQLLGGDGAKVHLVGSNPGFDANHLNVLLTKEGLPGRNGGGPWNHRLIDPAAAAYFLDPDADFGKPTGLKEASAATGVNLVNHHAARADVDAAAQIWHTLENRRRELDPLT